MKKKIFLLVPVLIVIFIIFYSNSGNGNDAYQQEIRDFQEERIAFLKDSDQSPFFQKKQPYQQIFFYAPKADFKVNATLEKLQKRDLVEVGKSDGSIQKYIKYAVASFRLGGKEHQLLILKQPGFGRIFFTAFRDKTSGSDTYGAGRYLDLEVGKSDKVTIDFNKAYNPYCAYVDGYQCPLPPKENYLDTRIEAGEKVKK